MLSDEEKKAIEYLKRHIIPCYGRKGTIEFMLNDTLLNLIEKQSKEIEELKENNKNLEDELNKYIVKMSDEQYRRLVDIIRDEINKLWEDKIKARIEEEDKLFFKTKDVRHANRYKAYKELLEKE